MSKSKYQGFFSAKFSPDTRNPYFKKTQILKKGEYKIGTTK